jgi:hypothetical protein
VVLDSRFHDNQALATMSDDGGALLVQAGGQLRLERSHLVGNRGSKGNALFVGSGSSAVVQRSVLLDASTSGATLYSAGALELSRTLLRGSGATGAYGVEMASESGPALLTNVTATNYGSGLMLRRDRTDVRHSTLAGNRIAITMDLFYNPEAYIVGTVVASSVVDCNLPIFNGQLPRFYSLGYNVAEDESCLFNHVTDRENTDPGLLPIGDLGTMEGFLPAPGSVLVDAAGSATCPAVDQRGLARPAGAACDIGAIERQAFEAPPMLFEDSFE